MRRFWTSILAVTALCAFSAAQETPGQETAPPQTAPPSQQNPASAQTAQPSPSQGDARIAPGSVIPVRLAKSIDAKKARTGEEVEAKVTENLKAGNGDVVVSKDTRVLGHITQAEARSKEQPQSEVDIFFDHAVMKDGKDLSLPMSIQAIIAPTTMTSDNAGPSGDGLPSGDQAITPSNGGRSPGMGNPVQAPGPSLPSGGGWPSDSQHPASNPRPAITRNTQGVVGFSDLTLATNAGTQGSLVTSQKSNVKIESGTLMLLRVNQ